MTPRRIFPEKSLEALDFAETSPLDAMMFSLLQQLFVKWGMV